MRKNTFWTVPLYCIAAGLVAFFLIVFGVGRFAVVTGPDGSVSSDEGRVLLIYGLVMAATLIIGGPQFFVKLTRKEIFISASVTVAVDLILLLVQELFHPTGSMAATLGYLGLISEWSTFVPLLLSRVTDSYLLCSIVGALAPYLFVLFGKKKLDQ